MLEASRSIRSVGSVGSIGSFMVDASDYTSYMRSPATEWKDSSWESNRGPYLIGQRIASAC